MLWNHLHSPKNEVLAAELARFWGNHHFDILESVYHFLRRFEITNLRKVNAQLSYENVEVGTNVNLLYNVYGRRIVGVGTLGLPDTYEEPFHQLDFVLRQKLPLKFAISLKMRNLLNLHARTRLTDKSVRRFLRGRTFSIGLSKSF